jgi:hypothetical protein
VNWSVPNLRGRYGGAASAEQELAKFGQNLLVATIHQKLDVLNDLRNGAC